MAEDCQGQEPWIGEATEENAAGDEENAAGEEDTAGEQNGAASNEEPTSESNISSSIAAFENAKAAGNSATSAGNFRAAAQLYTSALHELRQALAGLEVANVEHDQGSIRKAKSLHAEYAAVMCNRAHARIQLRQWREAENDATAVLSELAVQGGGMEKLRVKALWRRATAREALGSLWPAFSDLNLAVKAAPGNEGIMAAHRRVELALPPLEEEGDEYILDNSGLQSKVDGLLYRRSPRIEDLDSGNKAPWSSVVRGVLVNKDWLKVGRRFIPTNVRGTSCLQLRDGTIIPRCRMWKPGHLYNCADVMKLVDTHPQHVHGQVAMGSEASSEPAVRFASGSGISIHPGRDGGNNGCLKFIWTLEESKSQDCSQGHENATHDAERFLFAPCDGTHVEYDDRGNVRRFWQVREGVTSGVQFYFNRDGSVDEQATGVFGAEGRVESGHPLEKEFSTRFIFHVLMETVLPVKMALDIALSPGEERLVAENAVIVDDAIAATLGVCATLDA